MKHTRLLSFSSLLILAFLLPLAHWAQYQTPNTGVNWDMGDLVAASGGTVTGNATGGYLIHDDLILSETDTLNIAGGVLIAVNNAEALMEIYGTLYLGEEGSSTTIFPFSSIETYEGWRFESTSTVLIESVDFEGGGGLKVLTENFTIRYSGVNEQQHIATNNAALEFFGGSPVVFFCDFQDNQGSAISTPSNIPCSPLITSCVFVNNNTENTNRPQINLGPSLPDVPTILNNVIVSSDGLYDQVGGIACASLFGDPSSYIVQNSQINMNRYGLAFIGGNIDATVYTSAFTDNDIQGDPLLGGSGINLNGTASSSALLYDNYFAGNLWGITVQNDFQLDLGNPDITADSPGNNTFSENGNGGVTYALYNNTPSPIPAVNNCWIEGQISLYEEIEEVIYHELDDASLGFVDYSFAQCAVGVGLEENTAQAMTVYPSPASSEIRVILPPAFQMGDIEIIDLNGRSIKTVQNVRSEMAIDVSDLEPGTYLISLSKDKEAVQQLILID
ncbi:MAG: T9SS type A sorting domain-containing protein [Flavobacteriales bacterium]|nr:T9SS type A sorting domain-containing protein [Flavobacteriales bacterium]